ncbi:MAG: choice-of-anchor X domain-containing protein, partial [Candidatus Riflebacteria bacterium]
EMFDDGTHGDKLANDGIFTLRLTNLKTGSQQYSLKYLEEGSETPKTGIKDPHREGERNSYSELIIPESTVKLARGQVTSDLTGINYSEVKLSTKKGSRTIFCDSDGVYSMPMEGNGREYLVFRSANLHIRAIPVDLTTVTVYDVPTTTLSSKKSGEVKLIMVKSDFAEVTNPVVVADFTNWQPQQMYDDATNGDEVAGDGVYTRLFTGIAPGYHKYAFNITDTSQVKDPYQESGDSEYSIILVK